MKKRFIVWGLAGLVLCLLSGRAKAGSETYGTTGVSLSGVWSPFVSGKAGGDSPFWIGDAPKYSDLFSNQPGESWGARLGSSYDPTSSWRFSWGVAYAKWKGKPVEVNLVVGRDEQGNFVGRERGRLHFNDLTIWSADLGTAYRFLDGSPVRPYLGAEVGAAYFDHVGYWFRLDGAKFSGQYWRPTWTYRAAAVLGVEYAVTAQLALFLDVKCQLTGKPMSEVDRLSDAGPSVTLPVSLGVNYGF